MLNLSHAISHLSHAISYAILHLSHAISHLSQPLKNLKRYDCLNVWKQWKNFPGGTENKSDVFRHVICKRIFCQHSFFHFRTKKEWEGGLRRQSDVFLHDIRRRIFVKIILVVFAQKRNEKGDWNDSLTCFFLVSVWCCSMGTETTLRQVKIQLDRKPSKSRLALSPCWSGPT